MQLLITHGSTARTRVLQVQPWQLALLALALVVMLMAASGAIYHFIFLKAAREGWPVVSSLVRLVVRDEIAQRDRFMRENLDAMAQRVGEIQAKMVKLEAIGERVSGLAGMKPDDVKPLQRRSPGTAFGGKGGPFVAADVAADGSAEQPGLDELQARVADLDLAVDFNTDLFTYYDARLQESRLSALLVPSAPPVDGPVGSGFGFRADPINGRSALHTGLDFPAEVGTPILAAAGGMVVTKEWHAGYGHVLEIDHGNGLITRYAHCSSIDVEVGALVKRGQLVAKVGNSGRSTGSHLHFEVLLEGSPQDPARFLGAAVQNRAEFAARPGRR
jgi:murein DD-endopeptidase MepM/ murein hydrolase activator NlpD